MNDHWMRITPCTRRNLTMGEHIMTTRFLPLISLIKIFGLLCMLIGGNMLAKERNAVTL